MAIAGLIALENDLNAMLEQELAEQAEFYDWLNTQSSLTSHRRLLQSGFLGAHLVSGAPGENCLTQGLKAASGLVLGIAGAVAGQRALNGYLAAGLGATLKGVGVSLVASAGYVAAGVAVYALYEAAQCRFNRRNQPSSGMQSAYMPQHTAMEVCQATSVQCWPLHDVLEET
jgi:hypothetical protein